MTTGDLGGATVILGLLFPSDPSLCQVDRQQQKTNNKTIQKKKKTESTQTNLLDMYGRNFLEQVELGRLTLTARLNEKRRSVV